ncbi:hypothetical protein LPJ63_001259 [Coemansia sp. RSA 2711]|nr:hypothetical protein LPJ63_001259 [Coemansia sp. RSA 2711]KAJ2315945.1 hypothetical protein IWW52_003888 [Coemansia sp. RSA 2704]KAJ2723807.1 hypothetical protein H4R23_004327 [Coemansia sp. Cherry 401B]
MSNFYFDFAKLNAPYVISNGKDTVTIRSTKHVVETCVCDNCKAIMAHRKAEEAKKKETWSYKYTYTPPAPAAPKPAPCCCHYHHC